MYLYVPVLNDPSSPIARCSAGNTEAIPNGLWFDDMDADFIDDFLVATSPKGLHTFAIHVADDSVSGHRWSRSWTEEDEHVVVPDAISTIW